MKRLLIVLFSIASTLYAEESLGTQGYFAAFESEPSSFVNNVNVVSGTFHHSSIDLTIPGQEALHLQHFYSSDSCFENWMGRAALSTNFPTRVNYLGLKEIDPKHLYVESSQGSFLHYKSKSGSGEKQDRTYYLHPKTIHQGLTNTGNGELSARTNLKNSWFRVEESGDASDSTKADVFAGFGDGTYREYRRLKKYETISTIKNERKPNGNHLSFNYDRDERLTAIHLHDRDETESFGWLEFTYDRDKKWAAVSSSNGKSVEYSFVKKEHPKFGKMKYVEKIKSSDNPTVHFEYEKLKDNYVISKVRRPDDQFLEMQYDKEGRVTSQKGPLGRLWGFYYHTYQTEALDALNHKTLYHYSTNKRLTIIDRYANKKLLRRERFFWGDEADITDGYRDESNEGNLIGKALMNHEDKALSSVTYRYDSRGNVLHSTLFGNLTGNAELTFAIDHKGKPEDAIECYKKYFTYSDYPFNLTLSESEDDGSKVAYEYKEGTDLLTAKFIYNGNIIAIREFFNYNKRGTLIEKIIDDGDLRDRNNLHHVTERRITRIVPNTRKGCLGAGLPESITEYAYDLENQRKVRLSRREFRYNTHGLVTEEKHYDAQDIYVFTLYSKYDSKGRLLYSSDAIGREWEFAYDENNNKIYEELIGSGVSTTFAYDKMNRLVQKTEEHSNGEKLKEYYSYDAVGNKISSTDSFGNETCYEYDDLNRLIKIIFPQVQKNSDEQFHPTIKREYDEANNIISETNQNNATTHTSYNSRKQPIKIMYADGSSERFEYNLNGTLKRRWDKNDTSHAFEYDYQKRVTKEIVRDVYDNYISTTANHYSAFHLLSTEDAMHYTTEYSYDCAGRLQEVKKEQSRVTYEYDDLGRQAVTKDWNGPHRFTKTVKEFDFLNQVVEERQEHDSGTLLHKVTYAYDIRGNQTHIKTYSSPFEYSTHKTEYDSRNLPNTIRDELGAITTIKYDFHFRNKQQQKVLKKTTTDPLGNQTIEQYDALHRLVVLCQENNSHNTTQRSFLRYDGAGNKIKETHQVIIEGSIDHSFRIITKYDALNRPLQMTEQPETKEEKKTKYSYSQAGFLKTITKPDGVELTHTYDALGNLETLSSSDKTISYNYTYDKNSNPICIVDNIQHITHRRTFDAQGQVTKDFDIALAYDKRQRLKLLTLPDGSSVRYKYVGGHLSDVVRNSSSQKELYRHSYTSFDLEDHVLQSTLIGEAGTASFAWDKKGRCIATTTPHWSQKLISIDAADNLKKMTIRDAEGTCDYRFSYDDLYQLSQENDHTYEHDSLQNRLKKDDAPYKLDHGNKLLQTTTSNYSYDKNGNLLSRSENDLTTRFRYDALNRLIEACQKGKFLIRYTYDSLHRRLSKQTFSWTNNEWLEKQHLRFLYLAEREIGAIDASNTLIEFRALGRGKGADIGASVAIELNGITYAPIHDHRGNISALINASTGEVAETMRYTAFGEETSALQLSPWRFASKRLDPETGLIHFGQRDYCPNTGRWTTPDPAGFADGPNLYSYVRNRPMTFYDPYGLSFWDDTRDYISSACESVWDTTTSICEHLGNEAHESHSELLTSTKEEDFAAWDEVSKSAFGKFMGDASVYVGFTAITAVAFSGLPATVGAMALASGRVLTVSTRLTGGAAATAATVSSVALPTISAIGTVAVANEIRGVVANLADKTIYQQKPTDMVWGEVPATTGSPAQQGWTNIRATLERIKKGESFPHRNDGSIFQNKGTPLPDRSPGFYKEYVHPTHGLGRAGLQRIVVGKNGTAYYSPDHYRTFTQIEQGKYEQFCFFRKG